MIETSIEGEPMETNPTPPAALSTLPGAAILLRLRKLLVLALGAGVVYAVVLHASRGYCGAGGPNADGSVVTLVPCVTLTLAPSPLVYAALAAIVLAAVGLVLRRAGSEREAVAIFDRAAVIVVALVAASVAISYVWFFLIPIETWSSRGPLWYPFPFGAVELTTSTTG